MPDLESLPEEAEHLQSSRGLSRYRIVEADENAHFAATEWLCDDCGEWVEDVYEGCPVRA